MRLFRERIQVKLLDLCPRPGGAPQKLQTGFDTGILVKAFDGDAPSQFSPAILLDKLGEDHFKRNSVQGIVGLWGSH